MNKWLRLCVATVVLSSGFSLYAQDEGNSRDDRSKGNQEKIRHQQNERERGGEQRGQHHGEKPRFGGPGGEHGGPGGGDMMERFLDNPRMAEKLGLTEDQIAQMRTAAEGAKAQRETLMNQMKEAGKAQAEAMTAENIDENDVMSKVEEIGRIRTEMAKQQTRQLMAIQKILTPEQRARIKEHMQKMRDGERPGPGGEGRDGDMRQNMEQRLDEFQKRREEFQKKRGDEGKKKECDNQDKRKKDKAASGEQPLVNL